MSNDTISDLLHEVADAVEPGDRLDAIRAATTGVRRTGRGWWLAGGSGLVAAATVAAVVLATGNTPTTAPGPADSTGPSPTTPTATERPDRVAPVYYVGDTWAGPRLYREFRDVVSKEQPDLLSAAVDAAVGSAGNGRALAPLDPDYRTLWPPMTTASATLDPTGKEIVVSLGGDTAGSLPSRGDLTPDEASLALEQLIRTAQGVVGKRLPVRFLLYGEPADQVLGVPTSEPLTAGPDLDVLAQVNISDPFQGQVVDNDEPFVVTGVGTGYEGNIVTRIQRWEGMYVVDQIPAIASGEGAPRLWPYEVTFDLAGVPPGEYVVISQTEDPSGAGEFYTDTRQITIVD